MAPFSRQQVAGPSRKLSTNQKATSSPPANDNNTTSRGASSVTSPTLGGFSTSATSTSLRSRFSPRISPDPNQTSTFAAQQDTFPSPADPPSGGGARNLLGGWGRKKKRTESMPDATSMSEKRSPHVPTPIASRFGSSAGGASSHSRSADDRDLERSRSHSPSFGASAGGGTFAVPRYDARGYPIREGVPEIKVITPRTSGYETNPNDPSTPKRQSRPHSGQSSDDESSPRRPKYPPSSFDSRSSGASSTPPKQSRPHSDGSASDYSMEGFNMPNGTGLSPGGSLYGSDSVVSLATQDTIPSSAQHFASRDANFRLFTLQQNEAERGRSPQYSPQYNSFWKSEEDMRNSGYGDFGFKRDGKRILLNYGLENPAMFSSVGPEDDDDLHNPAFKKREHTSFGRSLLTMRGFTNVGCLALITLILVVLFMGYPIITEYTERHQTYNGAFGLGGTNATGQVPNLRGPIDPETPQEARTMKSLETGEDWQLIFSDEFNTPGRSFYPGDDPYWEGEDLHYWPTNNLEWYDPKKITTRDGSLVITLSKEQMNQRNYTGGMMTSWNKFCFTGGYIEVAVSLPGRSDVLGLWPAVWTMGNMARAGYGGTTDGLWPYSYDSCDVGTLKNQSLNGLPAVTTTTGDPSHDSALSYLSGQRLSSCTCPGDKSHPGPIRPDGTYIGRSAPEIDIFEAAVDEDTLIGHVSQSGQWAPFNPNYDFVNTSDYATIWNNSITKLNKWKGSIWQQATSAVTDTNQDCYTANKGCFSVYGFEYMPSENAVDGYITWVSDGRKAWRLREGGMQANTAAQVGQRPIPREPMYMIINLGISPNFGKIDFEGLEALWPAEMHVDYIRVYQDPKNIKTGCDPKDYPTADYIAKHRAAFSNPNITTFDQLAAVMPNLTWPKNRLIDQC